MKRRVLLWAAALVVVVFSNTAYADWKVETGAKIFGLRRDERGLIAWVPATAAPNGWSARLQMTCFVHPELSGPALGIVLSKETAPGFIGWQFQYDNGPAVTQKPVSRLSLTSVGLGDGNSNEYLFLMGAKRLKLTLRPASGPELPFEFDVIGAREAAKKLNCKIKN